MNQVSQVLSYLDSHRAKVATFLATVISYLTVTQQALSATDKATFVAGLAAVVFKWLDGNKSYEAVKLQLEAAQKVR